jgi:phage FluMu protein Com
MICQECNKEAFGWSFLTAVIVGFLDDDLCPKCKEISSTPVYKLWCDDCVDLLG